MKAMVLILFALALLSCDGPKNIADQAMKDLKSGELRYLHAPTGHTLISYVTEHSTRFIEHLYASDGKHYLNQEYYDFYPMVFDLPSDILSYTYVDSWSSDDTELYSSDNISKEQFDEIYRSQYENYEDFKTRRLAHCDTIPDCEYIAENDVLKQLEKVAEKRYHYRVRTYDGTERVTITLFETYDGWKIGMISREDI